MAGKRSTKEARKAGKAKKTPFKPFNLGLGINLELDFNLDDFDDIEDKKVKGHRQQARIVKPIIDKKDATMRAHFENAEAFAAQIPLEGGARLFSWVDGSFIFGDIVEALIRRRKVGVKRLYICSLSFSQENVDSLRNVMDLMGDELERVVLLFSAWEYSRFKFTLVPYMYKELDDPGNKVQIAFGRWHAKLITLETVNGNTITIHGSANLRSSGNIEQIMVEVNDRELHEYNARIFEDMAERFGTINTDKPYTKLDPVANREAWEVVTAAGEG